MQNIGIDHVCEDAAAHLCCDLVLQDKRNAEYWHCVFDDAATQLCLHVVFQDKDHAEHWHCVCKDGSVQ